LTSPKVTSVNSV